MGAGGWKRREKKDWRAARRNSYLISCAYSVNPRILVKIPELPR